MLPKNRRVYADDFPSALQWHKGHIMFNSLPGSGDRPSGERSHSRKRTWAVETSVHWKNNPQQTMASLSPG
jgi:hypothetical protein